MASIHKQIVIDAAPETVWEAVRAWDTPHIGLAPGFLTATRLDGEDRIVTFFNGAVARELLVDLDDERRRLVWSVVDGPMSHHNGVAQVFDDGAGRTRFVWTADLLPNDQAERVAAMMQAGIEAVKAHLDGARADAGDPTVAA